jgi:pimeloyl-ACP methyl ester carboxylesterase
MLYLHGKRDGCIGYELVSDLGDHLARGSRVVFLEDVGHFPQLEAVEDFGAAVLSFVGSAT